MATSGSINTSAYEGRYLQLAWERTGTNIAANPATSTIHWALTGAGSASSSWYYAGPFNVEINGQKVYQSSNRVQLYEGTLVASGTLTIAHSADGTCNFGAYVSAAIFSSSVNVDGSGSWALDALPRASSISCGTLTMGTAGTITITSASTEFVHKLSYRFGAVAEEIVTTTGGGTVSWAPPLSLASQIPAKTADIAAMTCQTYSGGTLIGSQTIAVTFVVPESVVPTISGITVSPVSDVYFVSSRGLYVAGLSKARVQTAAAGAYGSTISQIAITGGGSGADWTSAALVAGTQTIVVTATDSRGRQAIDGRQITVLPYSPPAVTGLTYTRGHYVSGVWSEDAMGDDVKIDFAIGLALTDQGNVCDYTVAVTGQSDQNVVAVAAGKKTHYFTGIGVDNSLVATVTAADSCGTYSQATRVIVTVNVDANYNPAIHSLRFGGVAEDPNTVRVSKPAIFDKAVTLPSGALADYIVEVGISGIWTYRKWASGIVECWGCVIYQNAKINALISNKYYWEMARIAYPSGLFANVPIESPTLMPIYGAQWGTPAANTKDETGVYGIWSDTQQTVNLQINFHVAGAWK